MSWSLGLSYAETVVKVPQAGFVFETGAPPFGQESFSTLGRKVSIREKGGVLRGLGRGASQTEGCSQFSLNSWCTHTHIGVHAHTRVHTLMHVHRGLDVRLRIKPWKR